MKKRLLSLLLAVSMLAGMLSATAYADTMPFTDLAENAWYTTAVQYVYDNGIMNGKSTTTFAPDANLTRAETCQILYNYEGQPGYTGDAFTDVSSNQWFYAAVNWAADNEIVNGMTEDTFEPDSEITREQMVTILYRYASYKGYDVSATDDLSGYTDAGSVGSWALTAMQWAVASGCVSGMTETTLGPQGTATRAQMATIMMRFCETYEASAYYVIRFESNGGSSVSAQRVAAGETAEEPDAPEMDGYRFVAWYTDSDLTTVYDFSTAVTASMTLYAKWEEVTSGGGSFLDEPNPDVEIYSFESDTWDILIGEEVTVTFTAEIFAEIELDADDVAVIDENNTVIGYMNDDGVDGDETADDGIYTLQVVLSSNTVQVVYYYATAESVVSDSVMLNYYRIYTDDDFDLADEIKAGLDEVAASYLTESGTVEQEDVEALLEALSAYLNTQVAAGKVASYYENEDSISVETATGYPFIYSFEVEGMDAGGQGGNIVTYQPFYGTYSDNELNNLSTTATDGSATTIAATFDDYAFTGNYDLDEVTLDELKSMSDYSVILWHGHGGINERGSYLMTGEIVNRTSSSTYSADISAGRILSNYSAAGRNAYAVTGGFFDKYLDELPEGTLVYLAACHSGEDMIDGIQHTYQLVQAFIDKGAEVVFANSDAIYTEYNVKMMSSILTRMCETDSDGKYYTAAEALAYAKSEHGATDGHGTEVIIFPQNKATASNFRFDDSEPGVIAGSVKSAETSSGISNALIRVYDTDGTFLTSTRTNSSGSYSLSIAAGSYVVKVSAGSYKSVKMTVTVNEGRTTYNETFLLVSAGITTGYTNGTVTDSITGNVVSGVTINVRSSWANQDGEILYTTTSNSNGYYEISLESGSYTIEYYKSGYTIGYKNIVIAPLDVFTWNISITPVVSDGVYRIKLTWGENPSDLDSHVEGTLSDGSTFHVYFGDKSAYDGDIEVCNLDLDDTSSYGPETITLIPTTTEPYYYYIYHWAGSGSLSTSDAHVEIYYGSTLVCALNVPTDQGTSKYWNVFAIVDGEIVIQNTITSSADTSYAESGTE